MITAVMIDSREPQWVQNLKFGGIPTMVTMLNAGDVWAVCDDGSTILVERKTPDDFLNSLKDDRIFPQLTRLAQYRTDEQIGGRPVTQWPYLVITDGFLRNGGHVTTNRDTGWAWSSVQGAILTIQEMGVMVVTCGGDADFEDCVIRLGNRDRSQIKNILPPRIPELLGPREAFIASLPGIGIDKTLKILEWSGGNVFHALMGLTDLSVKCTIPGIGDITRKKIRAFLGLNDGKNIEVIFDEVGQNQIKEM
jgi:hypothetical protein